METEHGTSDILNCFCFASFPLPEVLDKESKWVARFNCHFKASGSKNMKLLILKTLDDSFKREVVLKKKLGNS